MVGDVGKLILGPKPLFLGLRCRRVAEKQGGGGMLCQRKKNIYGRHSLGWLCLNSSLFLARCGPCYPLFFFFFSTRLPFSPILTPFCSQSIFGKHKSCLCLCTGNLGLKKGENREVNFVRTRLPSTI